MFRTTINGMAIAAALVLTGGAVLPANADAKKCEPACCCQSSKVSAAEAVTTAEQETGGRAVKLGIEDQNGTYLYEIQTATPDKVADAFIDPATGKVVRIEDKDLIARVFEREDRGAVAKLQDFPTTLATAITVAEKQTGGKTVEAEYGDEDDKAVFEIKVVRDSATQKVEIDAASGKVTKVSAAKHDTGEKK